jgi:putative NIF3 family GTP cyclohydrolase 1 type 2
MKKQDLINYLDQYLKINDFQDKSKNGLQVDNSKKEIKKIGYSVDASTYIFEKAKEEKVDMVLCHHGMYW